MTLTKHFILHWRRYTILERLLVIFPLTLVTPSLIPYITSLTHDGEETHELVTTIYLFVTLIVGICYQSRNLIRVPKLGSVQSFVCLFTLWTACSLIWTSSIGATLDQSVIWLDYSVLILLASACLRRRSKIGLASMLMVTAGLMAAFKLIGYAMVEGDPPGNTSLYKNIGVETEILVTLIPIFWIVFLSSRRKQIIVASLIVSIICIMASVSSYQRTPLLALIGSIGIIVIYVLAGWFRPRFMLRALILVFAIIFSYALQTNLPSKLYGRTGTEVLAQKIVDKDILKSSATGRFLLWGIALEMLIEHPFLGVGGGAYKAEYINYRTLVNGQSYLPSNLVSASFTSDQSDGGATNFRTHNEFFQVFGELGLVGGLILIAILFRLAVYLWSIRTRLVSSVVISGGVAFLISSNFSSFSFRWIPCGLAFFLLISITSSSGPIVAMPPRNYQQWVPYFAMVCLSLCCFRSGQVFLSQYFEAQGDVIGEDVSGIARDNYQLALWIDPYNFTTGFKLGSLYYRTREPEKAVPLLESALDMGINDVTIFQTLALAQTRLGKWEQAEATLQRGLKLTPSSVFLRVIYSHLLKQANKNQTAEVMINDARNINRQFTDAAEMLWETESFNANKYLALANRLGPLWGVMRVNRTAELGYKKQNYSALPVTRN